jgi:large subunit ribosomal protein L13
MKADKNENKVVQNKLVIDGEGQVMGRLASYAAKQALLGNEIAVLNSEKVIVTGTKENIVEKFQLTRKIGGDRFQGPYPSRDTEKLMKRAIRRMLPDYRVGRGREAWKRIRCYNGFPEEFKKDKIIIPEKKEIKCEFMTLSELKKLL